MLTETQKQSTPIVNRAPSFLSRPGLFCALLAAIAILATYPVLEMGTIDDWSYAKTALDSLHSGHIVYNGWANPMLGWQILWGAIVIKLFGFSFLALRLSTVPFAMGAAYLLYQTSVLMGLTVRNAVLVTLTVVLSPLFLPLAASFMTDIPAFFWLIAGLYACLCAWSAGTSRACISWLALATMTGVIGGTGRQTDWLIALVMVPSAAWLCRKQPGVLIAAALLWAGSVITILGCLHWFYQQPYALPEKIIAGPLTPKLVPHVLQQVRDMMLSTLLLSLPALSAFLISIRRGSKKIFFVSLGLGLLFLAVRLHTRGPIAFAPWLPDIVTAYGVAGSGDWEGLGRKPVVMEPWVRALLSCTVVVATCAWLAVLLPRLVSVKRWDTGRRSGSGPSWAALCLLLGPFSAAYATLLMPRAVFTIALDRYLLPLIALFAIVVLRFFQDSSLRVQAPRVSFVLLALFSFYAVAATHDFFSASRAKLAAASLITAAGVPRTQIEAGFEYDGWTQIEAAGYINQPQLTVPGAYQAVDHLKSLPSDCQFYFTSLTPAINPRYFVVFSPEWCLASSRFPAVEYRTWLPPFQREISIQQLP